MAKKYAFKEKKLGEQSSIIRREDGTIQLINKGIVLEYELKQSRAIYQFIGSTGNYKDQQKLMYKIERGFDLNKEIQKSKHLWRCEKANINRERYWCEKHGRKDRCDSARPSQGKGAQADMAGLSD